jgi:outer membrane protein OmpA-like peptidoglycan-associated protein
MFKGNRLTLAGLAIILVVTPLLNNCAWREGAPCDDVMIGGTGTTRSGDGGTTATGGTYDDSALRDKIADLERRLAANEQLAEAAKKNADEALKCCRKEYTIFATENIHFDFNKTNIRPADALILDKVAERMKMDPESIAELSGFADAVGNPDYNLALGQRRGESAKAYLVDKGISASRISVRTFGESAAVNPPESDVQTREADRRVTIDILSFGTE